MGWFWESKPPTNANDPYKNLGSDLKEYLKSQTPNQQSSISATSHTSDQPSSTYRAQLGLDVSTTNPTASSTPTTTTTSVNPTKPIVPPESQFQDGRYAHLWKTYRPQVEIDAAAQTDQDKLAAVVNTYKDRSAAIGRAAMENCVEYQLAEKECFASGSIASKINMCRDENRAFLRCYEMQNRFLKALGYLALQRSEEEDERIQMHADRLYGEMLEREARVKEAREKGEEEPVLPPLIRADQTLEALGEDSAWARARRKAGQDGVSMNLSDMSEEKQVEVKKRIEGLSKEEREVELQLLAAESRAKTEYAEKIWETMEEDRKHRADRRKRGKETVGDTIKRWWGWNQ